MELGVHRPGHNDRVSLVYYAPGGHALSVPHPADHNSNTVSDPLLLRLAAKPLQPVLSGAALGPRQPDSEFVTRNHPEFQYGLLFLQLHGLLPVTGVYFCAETVVCQGAGLVYLLYSNLCAAGRHQRAIPEHILLCLCLLPSAFLLPERVRKDEI